MSREEAIGRLQECQMDNDPDSSHRDADRVLCDLLRSLGYGDVVAEWDKVKKWYS